MSMHLSVNVKKRQIMNKLFISLLSAILLLMLLTESRSAQAAGNIETTTIFIDGISFSKSWFAAFPPEIYDLFVGASKDRDSNYLADSVLAGELRKAIGGDYQSINWSGSPSDTYNLDRAVSETVTKIMNANRAGKDVYLVTHSMGTVIGYLALARMHDLVSGSGSNKYRGVVHFITLASPLNNSLIMGDFLNQNKSLNIAEVIRTHRDRKNLLIQGQWINAHAQGDPIGSDIGQSWVKNLYLPFSIAQPIEAHSYPHSSPVSARLILSLLRSADSAFSPSGEASDTGSGQREGQDAASTGVGALSDSSEAWLYWLHTGSGGTLHRARPDGSVTSLIVVAAIPKLVQI